MRENYRQRIQDGDIHLNIIEAFKNEFKVSTIQF